MKKTMLAFGVVSILLASCGTGKKLKTANAQIENLNGQVTGLNSKVADYDNQVTQLKAESLRYGKEAEECRKVRAALSQRVDNLNSALAEKGTSMKQIVKKVDAALSSFESAGATITYKNGLVHITMEDKLAFASGSTKISEEGRQILGVVSDVLADNPGVSAIIVGNTDTVKVAKAYKDNWSLSTERANEIVRMLRDIYHVDPAKLTSAGRGKFNPVADNATPEGRAKNRRIEIILNPDLNRLWELSENP